MRPGRQLAVLGFIFVVLYLLVFFAGASGSWKDRLEPKLGLDLIGGTRVTLEATNSVDGKPPTAENLEEAREIIESRVNAFGVAEAEVVTEGNRNIVISLPGENRDLDRRGQRGRAALPQGAQGRLRQRRGRGAARRHAGPVRQRRSDRQRDPSGARRRPRRAAPRRR